MTENTNLESSSEKKIFLKKEATGLFLHSPEERTTEELLKYSIANVDKPKGPTSHQVSDYVQNIFGLAKAGHSGTLDPGVTGVQPTALGRATRIAQFLLTAPKEYVCLMHIHKDLGPGGEERIRQSFQKFMGKIQQMPPQRSAIKRQLRTREIYDLKILEIKGQDVLFSIKCQAGTYIRKICTDFGRVLGVSAHMFELRRTQAGPFTEKDNLVTLSDLEDAHKYYLEEKNDKFLRYCLQPIEKALKYLPKCWVLDTTIKSLTHGRDLGIPGISKMEEFSTGDDVALLTLKGELIAMGQALMSTKDIMSKDKGLALKVKKVFMESVE